MPRSSPSGTSGFASQMYQATLDLRLVSELMGHSSQATTANYAAFSRTGAAAAVASLPVPEQETAA